MWTAKNVSLIVSLLSFVGGSAAALNGILTGVPNEAIYVQIITGVAGYVGTGMGLVLAWMTRQDAQVQNVVAHIDDPNVKVPIAQAITSVKGVDHLQLNQQASADLAALGTSTSPENAKIEPPK